MLGSERVKTMGKNLKTLLFVIEDISNVIPKSQNVSFIYMSAYYS